MSTQPGATGHICAAASDVCLAGNARTQLAAPRGPARPKKRLITPCLELTPKQAPFSKQHTGVLVQESSGKWPPDPLVFNPCTPTLSQSPTEALFGPLCTLKMPAHIFSKYAHSQPISKPWRTAFCVRPHAHPLLWRKGRTHAIISRQGAHADGSSRDKVQRVPASVATYCSGTSSQASCATRKSVLLSPPTSAAQQPAFCWQHCMICNCSQL